MGQLVDPRAAQDAPHARDPQVARLENTAPVVRSGAVHHRASFDERGRRGGAAPLR